MYFCKAQLTAGFILFCRQKRIRKAPAISTRWIHEKGATRPFQTPKKKSKHKNASRFAKRIFVLLQFAAAQQMLRYLIQERLLFCTTP